MMRRRRWRGVRDDGAPAAPAGGPDTGGIGLGGGDAGPHADRATAGAPEAGPHPADGSPHPAEAGPRPGPARARAEPRVPGWLERAAGWAWRLLILAAVIYVTFRVVSVLRLVLLP